LKGVEEGGSLLIATKLCHPEAAEASAKPRTPNEGPMQLARGADAAGKRRGPFDKLRAGSSARKERGLQDDNAYLSVWVLGTY